MYERCRASGQKVRDAQLARSVEAASLGSLGNAYDRLEQYDKASDYYSRLLAIAEEIGDPQGVASSLNHLATAYYYSVESQYFDFNRPFQKNTN